MKLGIVAIFGLIGITTGAMADIASTTYVDTITTQKVDTSAEANQQLGGTYEVSGTLTVPTPDIPTA